MRLLNRNRVKTEFVRGVVTGFGDVSGRHMLLDMATTNERRVRFMNGVTEEARISMEASSILRVTMPGTNNFAVDINGANRFSLSDSAALFNIPLTGAGFPQTKLIRATNQTIADSTLTAVSWSSADFELGGDFWAIGNPTRVVLPVAGIYVIAGTVRWAASATGARKLDIRLNGSSVLKEYEEPAQASNARSQQIFLHGDFNPGDYIELRVAQFSGGNLDIIGGGTLTDISVIYQGG